jgi:N-glycosylase/DNA lyase
VGEKIANCVRLFAYGRLSAFPVDVWIERVLRERYFGGAEIGRKDLLEFVGRHFGDYGGYAQQYLFHHARTSRGNSRSRP